MVFYKNPLRKLALVCATLALTMSLPAEDQSTAPATPETASDEDAAKLHAVAQDLWDEFVPDSIKAEYELIKPEQLQTLLSEVENAGQQESLAAFASHAPAARTAITALQALPAFADYAGWLRDQLEDMEAAQISRQVPPPIRRASTESTVPLFDLWLGRIAQHARPGRADEFLPTIRAAFVAEGVPESLVWLAETESSFNPNARSPVGARGLFQLMPATAKSLGLSLFPLDQRTHPQASAHAAAVYLRKLYARFGDWPLVLAAYNAGQGRVSRTLKAENATDFAGIADHLPAETQLYVPKVLATVQIRTGVTPARLAEMKMPPRS